MRLTPAPAVLLTAACALTLPADAETIVLTNGDVINAAMTAETDTSITIDHPALGEVTFNKEQVKAVYADPEAMKAAQVEAAAKKKADAKAAEVEADDGLFGSGFLAGWNRRLKLGLNGAEGNSQNINFRIAFHGDYEDAEDRWIYDMVYRTAESDGETTQNQFFAALTKDWLVPDEDYFYFVNGRYDWDEFQDWDSRLSGFLGGGYQFLDDETWNVRGRAGIGGNQEIGGTVDGDEFTPEGLVGVEADYTISDGHNIAFTNYVYPSLEDFKDFRNVTTLDYVIGLNDDMDLTLGLANEYDSAAASGTKKNDFTYYITLGWAF